MPEEFEGDLAGAVFWGADLSGAMFRDVKLEGATISHAWVTNVNIDALVDNVVRERARSVVPAAKSLDVSRDVSADPRVMGASRS